MARFNSNGLKTFSHITANIRDDFTYKFWISKRTGRYPNFDETTEESHLEGLFAIPHDANRLRSLSYMDNEAGGKCFGPHDFFQESEIYRPFSVEIEQEFLRRIKAKLNEANVECSFIARGSCSRRGKQAWTFKTTEYLVKAEKNAVLLKLIGIERMIEDVWTSLEEQVTAVHAEFRAEQLAKKQKEQQIHIETSNLLMAKRKLQDFHTNLEKAIALLAASETMVADINKQISEIEDKIAKLKES